MEEANRIFPEIHSLLFKQFHIGMPVTPYKPEETISSVCKNHNVSIQSALDFLNKEFSEKNISIISCEELKKQMDAGNKPILLDIRVCWDRVISKIEGSHIINAENNEHVLSSFQKNQEMVLIDWKQDRSPSFQKWLTQRGYTNIKCLEGGIDLWSERIDTRLNRYDIDEDDGYRYEDILDEPDDHEGHDHDHPEE